MAPARWLLDIVLRKQRRQIEECRRERDQKLVSQKAKVAELRGLAAQLRTEARRSEKQLHEHH